MSDKPKCETCKHWVPQEEGTVGYYPGAGLCHRYPEKEPKRGADWCGEHQPMELEMAAYVKSPWRRVRAGVRLEEQTEQQEVEAELDPTPCSQGMIREPKVSTSYCETSHQWMVKVNGFIVGYAPKEELIEEMANEIRHHIRKSCPQGLIPEPTIEVTNGKKGPVEYWFVTINGATVGTYDGEVWANRMANEWRERLKITKEGE